MAKVPRRQINRIVDDNKSGLIEASFVDVPFTEITNRAKIIDLENDLSVNFGITRIPTQDLSRVEGEVGNGNRPVWEVPNDKYSQIRLVGDWTPTNAGSGGVFVSTLDEDDYIEVTFYGTGLNVLSRKSNADRDIKVAIDGGAYGGDIFGLAANGINAIAYYSANNVFNAASGLPLGWHTIKVANGSTTGVSFIVYGIEILNEGSDLEVNPGKAYINGLEVSHDSAESISYNSGFTNETGTAAGKGGRVLVYMDDQGNIKKDITHTDTERTLEDSDHSNEEIARVYHYHEFGCGRSIDKDDFSSLVNSTTTRAFTLMDNTTTLVANSIRQQDPDVNSGMVFDAATAGIIFTFVGTGIDLKLNNATATTSQMQVFIDGTEVTSGGTLNIWPSIESQAEAYAPIASGLPYGTHVVRLTNATASGTNTQFVGAKVYIPKKPQLPENCIELADYNLMADFVGNSTDTFAHISTGTLRKSNRREMNYEGTGWTSTGVSFSTRTTGYDYRTSTPGESWEYTFFGTGADIRLDSNGTATFEIDGSSDFSSVTSSHYGTGTWTPAVGTLVGNLTNSEGIIIDGLPLGTHKLKVTFTSGTGLYPESVDVITPIHSYKSVNRVVHNEIDVGSQCIADNRAILGISDNELHSGLQTFILEDPSNNRADVNWEFLFNAHHTVKSKGGIFNFKGAFDIDEASGSGAWQFQVGMLVDGVYYGGILSWSSTVVDGNNRRMTWDLDVPLSEGWHTIKYIWRETSNRDDIRIIGFPPRLEVREIKS
jgi:hypothetical protein